MPDGSSVIIPGYLDGYQPAVDPATLLDATAWLDQPAVSPALLRALGGARTAIDAFDVDPAEIDAPLDQLGDPYTPSGAGQRMRCGRVRVTYPRRPLAMNAMKRESRCQS